MFKFLLSSLLLVLMNTAYAEQADPTRPFGASATRHLGEKTSKLVLQSIMVTAQTKKAVIGGKLMKIGDKINGYELISISPKTVVLASSQRRMKLSLFSGVVAKSK